MKPSEKCKSAGLKGLAELVEITGKCRRTLINWNSASPLLFEIVLRGAVATKAIKEREFTHNAPMAKRNRR